MVALALLSLAVSSAGALASTASRTGNEAGRRTQATALAASELEGLRNWRDTQLRRGNAWPFAASPECVRFVMRQNTSTREWEINTTATTHQAFANPNFNGFRRLLTACNSSEYVLSGATMVRGSRTPNVKSIQVEVIWDELGGTRKVQLETVLTNWKQ